MNTGLLKPAFGASALLLALICSPVPSSGQGYSSIDISKLVNADLITQYTNGTDYPPHGGSLTVTGIPFTLSVIPPNSDTAVIQGLTVGTEQTFSIPVGQVGVTTIYTLINSVYGVCGTPVGELDFVGATSPTFVYVLTEGSNIRDHNEATNCNTVTDVAGTANFGGGQVRFDMQQIGLPESFAKDTLVSITFKSYGFGLYGTPFIAGLTVPTNTSCVPGTSGMVTGFNFQEQQGQNWCWAAATSMLIQNSTGAQFQQCAIANQVFQRGVNPNNPRQPYCCGNVPACDLQSSVGVALGTLGFQSSTVGKPFFGLGFTPELIMKQIGCRNRIIAIQVTKVLGLGQRASHFMIVYGYRESGGDLILSIFDPQGTFRNQYKFEMSYEELIGMTDYVFEQAYYDVQPPS